VRTPKWYSACFFEVRALSAALGRALPVCLYVCCSGCCVRWKLSWRKIDSVVWTVVTVLVLSSCGKPKEESGAGLAPTDPGGTTTTTPVTPETAAPDSRLPNLDGAVAINLVDKVTYKGLEDLAGNLFLPIVGDAKVKLELPKSRTADISGKILIAFEDKLELWWAVLESFPGTGTRSSTQLDIVFADDELVIRTVGNLSGDNMDGNIYYRIKKSGEDACVKKQVTCEWVYPTGYFKPFGSSSCPVTQPDTATPCKAYMNLNDSSVKKLGTFKGKYSSFATLSEGQ
jgi:hypothetical protein